MGPVSNMRDELWTDTCTQDQKHDPNNYLLEPCHQVWCVFIPQIIDISIELNSWLKRDLQNYTFFFRLVMIQHKLTQRHHSHRNVAPPTRTICSMFSTVCLHPQPNSIGSGWVSLCWCYNSVLAVSSLALLLLAAAAGLNRLIMTNRLDGLQCSSHNKWVFQRRIFINWSYTGFHS